MYGFWQNNDFETHPKKNHLESFSLFAVIKFVA